MGSLMPTYTQVTKCRGNDPCSGIRYAKAGESLHLAFEINNHIEHSISFVLNRADDE